jgi:hypothetical protein
MARPFLFPQRSAVSLSPADEPADMAIATAVLAVAINQVVCRPTGKVTEEHEVDWDAQLNHAPAASYEGLPYRCDRRRRAGRNGRPVEQRAC